MKLLLPTERPRLGFLVNSFYLRKHSEAFIRVSQCTYNYMCLSYHIVWIQYKDKINDLIYYVCIILFIMIILICIVFIILTSPMFIKVYGSISQYGFFIHMIRHPRNLGFKFQLNVSLHVVITNIPYIVNKLNYCYRYFHYILFQTVHFQL